MPSNGYASPSVIISITSANFNGQLRNAEKLNPGNMFALAAVQVVGSDFGAGSEIYIIQSDNESVSFDNVNASNTLVPVRSFLVPLTGANMYTVFDPPYPLIQTREIKQNLRFQVTNQTGATPSFTAIHLYFTQIQR